MTILAVPLSAESRWSGDLLCWEVRCRECGDCRPCDTDYWHRDRRRTNEPQRVCRACQCGRWAQTKRNERRAA